MMIDITTIVVTYLKKIDHICERELMLDKDLVEILNICQATLIRIRKFPETCSVRTVKKIKRFVDAWEVKNENMSVIH